MKISFSDIENAFIFSSGEPGGESCVYLCRETGRMHYISEYDDSDEDVPDDLDDNPRYVALPDKHDLDLGTALVHRFIRQHAPALSEEVDSAFSRRGAYARFKGLLDRHGLLDAWYDYEAEQTEAALREWCAANDIDLTPTDEATRFRFRF